MHENRCALLKSDMHVRPIRFTVLCTPIGSSYKTQLMCSITLLCLFYHRLKAVQPSWTTVPCPTTKLCLLISKSIVGIKQSVISVAFETPLIDKIGSMCLQSSPFRVDPMTILVLHQAVPPTFYNKIAPMDIVFDVLDQCTCLINVVFA